MKELLKQWIEQKKLSGWNLKYAELLHKIYSGGLDTLTDEEKKLFKYCVSEGFIDVEEV